MKQFISKMTRPTRIVAFHAMILFSISGFAQDLYIPRNIQQSYQKGTRSPDGKPGPEYWQNQADYDLRIELDPGTHLLSGRADIVYKNNSPDTLRNLFFHLYPNYFQRGNNRDYDLDPEDENEGVMIHSISVNGKDLGTPVGNRRINISHTLMRVTPEESVLPGAVARISISWEYTINEGSHIRTGMVDQTSFFVAYFYPHLAVYDDVDGWDVSPYTGEPEFYNDFGNYSVTIIVPRNYVVWATGELQNPEQVLREPFLSRFCQAKTSDEIIHIVNEEETGSRKITSSNKTNTWKFKADQVVDFAFGVSNHYLWDAISLVVDETSGRKVLIQSAYNKDSDDFYQVCDISRKTISYLSTEFPAVPYPYPSMTVFNGLSEMEYPMIVNDISLSDRASVIELTSHEIAHTYFPFYMGTNETKYAWMDEGWAVLLEYYISSAIGEEPKMELYFTGFYRQIAGRDTDLPLITGTKNVRNEPYWINSYPKAGIFLYILRDYLGEELFKKATQEYIRRWNGKHPIPHDFFNTYSTVTGEDLGWLFYPWFYAFGYPDLVLEEVEEMGEIYRAHIGNSGGYPVPVNLKIVFEDGSEEIIHQTAGVWKNGNEGFQLDIQSSKPVTEIMIIENVIPEINSDNNRWINY